MYQLFCFLIFVCFRVKKQTHGFLQPSCKVNLYCSKKVNTTKQCVCPYNAFSSTLSWCYQLLYWTLHKILGKDSHLYAFLCQVFFISWRVIGNLTLTCLWSWMKVGDCWSVRMRGDEGSSCLFPWSSGEPDKICWDKQKPLQMCKPPCSHHTHQVIIINGEWWGLKKK